MILRDVETDCMTPKEVGIYIGCSEYTVKDMARRKEIPHYRVGKLYKFRKKSIDRWIEQQETGKV